MLRFLWAMALGVATLCGTTYGLSASIASGRPLSSHQPDKPILLAPLATRSVIYDANGAEMALLFADEDRQEIPLDSVPDLLKTAVIVTEDEAFYSHKGVNLKSAFRALLSNVNAGETTQGGSTITQQLIKNSLLTSEQTLERKVNEAVLALRLEKQISKDEILERYLNTVYLGHGAYGLQAASETYFDKSVATITWPEAALLAALIKNPVGYDPIQYPDLVKERRSIVARRLLDEGEISEAVRDEIDNAPLPSELFKRSKATASAQLVGGSYFSEEVKQQLLDMVELGATPRERYDSVFKGGLRVKTTYEPDAQAAAELALLNFPDTRGQFFAAVASVESTSGAIRAMVGGPNYEISKTNYVTQGWRQPGSSFKMLVLAAAFDAGYVPADTISGISPCKFPDANSKGGVYSGTNSSGGGKVADLTSQTTASSNCAFLRLGQTVGLEKVAALAESMDIRTIDENFKEIPLSDALVTTMPLGAKEVHPLAMAGAYAAMANDGLYHKPYYIEEVTDSKGTVLFTHVDPGRQVVTPQTARLVTQVLAKNVTSGTGRNARLKTQVAAGKTGTTQENADAWFVGYTPQLATAVWIGSPTSRDKLIIRGKTIFGADYPAKIWKAYMEPMHADLEPVPFTPAAKTRKGKAIRYTNKVDKGGTVRPKAKTTTTIPGTPPVVPTPEAPANPAPPEAPAAGP